MDALQYRGVHMSRFIFSGPNKTVLLFLPNLMRLYHFINRSKYNINWQKKFVAWLVSKFSEKIVWASRKAHLKNHFAPNNKNRIWKSGNFWKKIWNRHLVSFRVNWEKSFFELKQRNSHLKIGSFWRKNFETYWDKFSGRRYSGA